MDIIVLDQSQETRRRLREDDMSQKPQPDETQRLMALARSKGYAVNPDDVRRQFGDEPLTPEAVLRALATASSAPSMEVNDHTSDAELDAFLFGE